MWKSVRRVASVLVLLLVIEYLVIPQLGSVRKSLGLLGGVRPWWIVLGLGFEFGSLYAYARLTQGVLPARTSPGVWTILRIQLATLSVSHVVPGGAAAGGGLGYRLLTSSGVSGTDAAFALATQSIGSAVVLNALLWLGLVVSIPLRGYNPLYLTAAIVGALVVGAFSLVVIGLMRGQERAADIVVAVTRRIPKNDEDKVCQVIRHVAERLRTIAANRPLMLRTVGWAAVNWLLDMASLWVFLLAFGYRVGIDGLIVSYGLAYVLASIPLTPGGLGVVEAVLVSTLVGFGAPHATALLGVVAYRFVNFWLPIPVGAGVYLSLHLDRGERRRAAELRRVAAEAVEGSEDVKDWAKRHGVKVN